MQDLLKSHKVVKVGPKYPQEAIRTQVEGWVLVEYSVDKEGKTKNIIVLESHPKGIFDKAAVRATGWFRYRPIVRNGKAVERHGVTNRFTFNL